MTKFKQIVEAILKEGIYDPSIFKAVFLAGGPGAGKGYIASLTGLAMGSYQGTSYGTANQNQAFLTYDDIIGREIRQSITQTGPMGLKVVNVDDFSNWFNLRARGWKKAVEDMKQDEYEKLASVSLSDRMSGSYDSEYYGVTNPDPLGYAGKDGGVSMNYDKLEKENDPLYKVSQANRDIAKKSYHNRLEMYKELGLGILIDQTSSDYDKVFGMKWELEDVGYDCMMLNVQIDRELAWKLNLGREGKAQVLGLDKFNEIWDEIDSNRDKFARLFHENYYEIRNKGPGFQQVGASYAYLAIKEFCEKPPTNPDVRAWMEWMLSSD